MNMMAAHMRANSPLSMPACLKGVRESQQRPAGVWAGVAERDLSAMYFLSSGIKAVLQGNSYDTFLFPMLILSLEGKN